MIEKHYTVSEVADMLSVEADKVREWIHSGDLEAMNLGASKSSMRPSWRIGAGALCRFLTARATASKREVSQRPAKPKTPAREFVK
jgi:excisionase family DNA binding protein